jgi:transmembrane sensor
MKKKQKQNPRSFFWDQFLKTGETSPEDFPWQDISPITPDPDPKEIDRQYLQLKARLHAHPAFRKAGRSRSRLLLTGIAATVALILLTFLGLWFVRDTTTYHSYATGYGEFKELLLPDGSQVKLHANSSLRLMKNWEEAQDREVWLEGQAYFTVTRQATSSAQPVKFIVHANDLQVEVLGTRFDVRNRAEDQRVILESGKVRLSYARETGALSQVLYLQPGDMVVVDQGRQELIREQVAPEEHISWVNDFIILKNRPLGEVAKLIEETFGVKVKIRDKQTANLRLSGTIPLNDFDKLIKSLQIAGDLSITRDDNTIMIEQNKK